MAESVYIVKLYSDPTVATTQSKFLSLSAGCGIVLAGLGLVLLVFGGLGLAVEMEVNRCSGGLWTGVICLGRNVDMFKS